MVGATRAARGQGEDAVRRLILLVAVAGCAQLGAPPGGPEDRDPPHLLRISPDTNAVNARPRSVELRFDEIINERPGARRRRISSDCSSCRRDADASTSDGIGAASRSVRGAGGVPNTTYTSRSCRACRIFAATPTRVEHHVHLLHRPDVARRRSFAGRCSTGSPAARRRARTSKRSSADSLTYGEFADSLGRFVHPLRPARPLPAARDHRREHQPRARPPRAVRHRDRHGQRLRRARDARVRSRQHRPGHRRGRPCATR